MCQVPSRKWRGAWHFLFRQKYDFPILGIEPAVKPAVQSCKGKRKKVLVLETNLTLKEEKFHT